MQKKIYNFLRSIGIEDPETFDLDFSLVGRNPHRKEQVDMFMNKSTPWDPEKLEEFLHGLSHIRYPYSLRFCYEREILPSDVLALQDAFRLSHLSTGLLPASSKKTEPWSRRLTRSRRNPKGRWSMNSPPSSPFWNTLLPSSNA